MTLQDIIKNFLEVADILSEKMKNMDSRSHIYTFYQGKIDGLNDAASIVFRMNKLEDDLK